MRPDFLKFFRFEVTDHHLNKLVEFDNRNEYFNYRAKDFFGFVLRTEKPLEQLIFQEIPVIATARLSRKDDGSKVISGFLFTQKVAEEPQPLVTLEIGVFPGNFGMIEYSDLTYIFNDKKEDVRGFIRIVSNAS